jgi:TPR repeat protein
LGVFYFNGQGVDQDHSEAVKWWTLAAAKNNAQAQGALGYMYGNGLGVPKDPKESIRLTRLSANQGNAEAQFNLGVAYDLGLAVDVDFTEAYKWYSLSIEGNYGQQPGENYGQPEARREALAKKMTLGQIENAEKLARSWSIVKV